MPPDWAVTGRPEVYLDNNATTRVLPEVAEAVARTMRDGCGNPSSVHAAGARARKRLWLAREQVAALVAGRSGRRGVHRRGHRSQQLGAPEPPRRADGRLPPGHDGRGAPVGAGRCRCARAAGSRGRDVAGGFERYRLRRGDGPGDRAGTDAGLRPVGEQRDGRGPADRAVGDAGAGAWGALPRGRGPSRRQAAGGLERRPRRFPFPVRPQAARPARRGGVGGARPKPVAAVDVRGRPRGGLAPWHRERPGDRWPRRCLGAPGGPLRGGSNGPRATCGTHSSPASPDGDSRER